MSHELEINANGEAQGMFAKRAWHRLGQVMDRTFSWFDMVQAGLTITLPVEKVPMSELIIGHDIGDDEYAMVRQDGRIIKCGVGEQATVLHPEVAHAFGEDLKGLAERGGYEPTLVSGGTLRQGRQWFFTYKLGTFKIGDHTINDNLTMVGSFDGTLAFQTITDKTIVVCANTMTLALGSGQLHYKFKHTSGIGDRVEAARAALRQHEASQDTFKETANTLLAMPNTARSMEVLLAELFPLGDEVSTKAQNVNQAARTAVRRVYEAADGIDLMLGQQGTAWGAVQAVNTWENWGANVRKTKGLTETDTRSLRQFDQLVSGKQPYTDKAVKLLLGV